MKKLNVVLFIFMSAFTMGQTSPAPFYVPANHSVNFGPDVQAGQAVIAGAGGYNAGGLAEAVVEGLDYVAAVPGYQAANFTYTGFGCLRINPNLLKVASFHDNGWDHIPKYERFEIGIKLPVEIQNLIDNFIEDPNFPNEPNYLNPYDPDKIKVECVFFVKNNPGTQYKRHGFYEAYTTSTNISTAPAFDQWVTGPVSPYSFRVRFAPPAAAVWVGIVNVYLNGNSTPNFSSGQFQFDVINNTNKGHLFNSTNQFVQKFMYDDGTPFYGVGRNIAVAGIDSIAELVSPTPDNLQNVPSWCNWPYYETKTRPTTHNAQRQYIQDALDNGCNLIRIRLDRTSVPIEESPICSQMSVVQGFYVFNPSINDLTNFSRNEKFMWEMDRTLKVFEDNQVHMTLTILDDQDFSLAPANGHVGWLGNPYRKIPSVTNRNGFFGDPTAKNTFKKRLYYIEARWGYSTGIGAWEMINETERMNPSGPSDPPWDNSTSYLVGGWLCEMRSFLRGNDIYPHHPVGNGAANPAPNNVNYMQPTTNMCLDYYTDHEYFSEMNGNTFKNSTPRVIDIGLFYSDYWNAGIPPLTVPSLRKPHLMGEYGLDGTTVLELHGPLTFHNQNWGSIFANSASVALKWSWWYDQNANPNPYHKQYRALRQFVDKIDFNTLLLPDRNVVVAPWRPFISGMITNNLYTFNETDLSPVQTFWMKKYDESVVYGWTKNTSANYMSDGSIAASGFTPPNYTGPVPSFPFISSTSNLVRVQGLQPGTSYNIEIYDTWDPNGAMIDFRPSAMVDGFGVLRFGLDMLDTPPFGTNPYPDYAFIARIDQTQHESKSGSQADSSAVIVSMNGENKAINAPMRVFPIPASDKAYIIFNKTEWSNYKVYIIDELGKITEKSLNTDNSIDTRELANGFYILKMRDEKHEQLFKLIIQH